MLHTIDDQPAQKKDVIVVLDRINVRARCYSNSYIDWNFPEQMWLKRVVKILRDHDGKMHYSDFMKEYKRRYLNG